MFVCDLVDVSLVHDPLRTRPLRILRILDVRNLAVCAKDLQAHAYQTLLLRLEGTRIHEPLDLPVLDLLNDEMLLRFHAGIALDLIIDDVAVRRVRTRHDMLVEENGTDTHDKAEQNRRCGDASETDAAGFHRRDLTRGRQASKGQETREQHGHRECPHDNAGQTEHKDLDDRRQRRTVVRNILRNAKERARADKDRRERTDGKEEGQKDLPKDVFVEDSDLQTHRLSSDRVICMGGIRSILSFSPALDKDTKCGTCIAVPA